MPAKLSLADVSTEFANVGYELLSTEYKNQHERLKYRCECGSINYITYKSFRAGQKCNHCKPIQESDLTGLKAYSQQVKLKYNDVKKVYDDDNCVLLSLDYKNNNTKMWFICKCGKFVFNNFKRFQEGVRCKNPDCKYENFHESNNWNSKCIEYTYKHTNLQNTYRFDKFI
jgi:hypothetical protein